ncbi:hypothetical protein [Nonlabens sp.]|uniref:hypothetical protein n=1 Tax=Nonlabens sp. TaxID=1888209 RepID=UPI003F69E44F
MKKKKLHFLNMKWRQYSRGKQFLMTLPFILLYALMAFFFWDTLVHYQFGLITNIALWAYLSYPVFLKNAVFYRQDHNFTLKIKGKKLDLDLKFLSEVWIENKELNIRRINRVDSFDMSHLREKDVNKLFNLLKEYEPQAD